MAHSVGDTVTIDGIESLIIYDAGVEQPWGRYILVDKNHDLVYYFAGTDYEDESENSNIINTENKYGYEWGGYDIATGIKDASIGSGLTNTNSLIGMNLQPNTDDWYVVWDRVSEFRSGRSDKWFVPSREELNLIYENRDNLNGLTTINVRLNSGYWSSSEYLSITAWTQNFYSDVLSRSIKYSHFYRTRLCRYTTDSELDKKVWTNEEIITSTELNRIENRIKELHSSYSPTTWNKGDVLSKENLNKIETQIGNDKVWEDGNVVTADDLNDIENYLI